MQGKMEKFSAENWTWAAEEAEQTWGLFQMAQAGGEMVFLHNSDKIVWRDGQG